VTKRRRLTWVAIALGALVVLANAGAAAAYLYDSAQADQIAPGVTVAGVDVGGLSRSAAQARLESALVPRLEQPLVLAYGAHRFTVSPQRNGLRVDVDGMLANALAASRRGGLISRFVREVRGQPVAAEIPLAAAYSRSSVDAIADRVARSLDRPARAANVTPSADKLAVVPARWGLAVQRHVLAAAVRQALVNPHASRTITIPVRAVKPSVTTAGLAKKYAAFITVDREAYRLTFWKNLKPFRRYTIAVGRAGLETPAGLYTIDDKQVNPSWHVPRSAWAGSLAGQVIPPGPDDPIKARWMGFWNGAGIHGTDELSSLGTAASHGCIRMAIPDVEQLYDLVPLGTPIYVG